MPAAPTGVLLVQLGTPDAPTPARAAPLSRGVPRRPARDRPAGAAALAAAARRDPAQAPARIRRRVPEDLDAPRALRCASTRTPLPRRSRASSARATRWRSACATAEPRIDTALAALAGAGATRLLVWPLFPQYAEASTGSALAHVFQRLRHFQSFGRLRAVGPCFDDPGLRRPPGRRWRSPSLDGVASGPRRLQLPRAAGAAAARRGSDAAATVWRRRPAARRSRPSTRAATARSASPRRARSRPRSRLAAGQPLDRVPVAARARALDPALHRRDAAAAAPRRRAARSRCCARPSSPTASRRSRRSGSARATQWRDSAARSWCWCRA